MRLSARIGFPLFFAMQLNFFSFAQSGVIATIAGPGLPIDSSSAASQAIDGPSSLAPDGVGGAYVAISSQNQVYRITAGGKISLIAGTGIPGFSGDYGPATSAKLDHPTGVAVDAVGNLFVADSENNRVRKVAINGMITTVAGDGTADFSGDGDNATTAGLSYPRGLAIDSSGNLFIADCNNSRIRKVTPAGIISTVAGIETAGFSGDKGSATSAELNHPTGVAIDSSGNLFIADSNNSRIREVRAAYGDINTVAGNGGPANAAQLNFPTGIASDSSGNLYVADYANNRIRKVSLRYSVTSYFTHVAVGNNCSTLFQISNKGFTTTAGALVFTDSQGNPFPVKGTIFGSTEILQPALPGSTFPFTLPAGETISLLAAALTPENPVKLGWARLESIAGSLAGAESFEYVVGTELRTMEGPVPSRLLELAAVSVDNNSSQGKQVAYAIANPGNNSIILELALAEQDGTVVGNPVTLTLGPGQQIAKYLCQDFPCDGFRGSLVITGQAGASFIAAVMSDDQGFLAAIRINPRNIINKAH
jgi:sugar lactone lactonase YvrE